MHKQSFLFLLLLLGVALLGAYHALSGDSATVLAVRFLALSAFFLLCVSLMIGPLAVFWPHQFASLIEPRRAIGLAAFLFGALHILLTMSLYFNWNIGAAVSFLPNSIAAPAAVILLAVALTSCDFAVSRLGMAKWKSIQRLVYAAFVLLLAHFLLKSNGLFAKGDKIVPLNLAEAALLLLAAITIVLQIAGFYTRTTRKADAKKTEQ